MILAILRLFIIEFILGEIATANSGSTWVGDNSTELQIDGNILICDGYCNAMWQENDGVDSGDHYWKIHFVGNGTLMTVSLTTKEDFEKNKQTCPAANLRQQIQPGDIAGILASFSDGRLKIYYGYNNQSLEEIFEIDAASIHGSVYPTIQFSGRGRITITKEEEVPSDKDRKNLQNIDGIEGNWNAYPENINFGTNLAEIFSQFPSHKNLATLVIKKESPTTIGRYKTTLSVINNIWFQMRAYGGFWRSDGAATTLIGGPPKYMDLEYKLSYIVQSPDSVEVGGEYLTLKKGDNIVKFLL